MAKVPLVETAPLSEFGDLLESADFNDPHGMARDSTYVPGFSEMRREYATKAAEYERGQRGQGPQISRDQVPTLDVNLRWARNQAKDGKPDNVKPFGHSRLGYRMVTKDDVGQPWLKELPGGAFVQADGTIRNGDTVLMVTDRRNAARNELQRRLRTEERVTGTVNSFSHAIEEAKKNNPGLITKGLDPSVTIEGSTPPADAAPVSAKKRS